MWRTWPMLSAKMVAQKPGESVRPPLSPGQVGTAAATGVASFFAQPVKLSMAATPMVPMARER